jgi:hypothetical protein
MATQYVLRKQGNGLFGLGEEIIPGVTLFRAGMWDLTKEDLARVVLNTTVQSDKPNRGRRQ